MRKIKLFLGVIASIVVLLLFQNCNSRNSDSPSPEPAPDVPPTEAGCTSVSCASTYSLLVADLDGSNVSLIKTSSYQDMTHPRVSNDKNWVAYTTYNNTNKNGCASVDSQYINTEIRVVHLSGKDDKRVIAPVAGQLNSNNYWIGTTNEFSYLSGPPSTLKFYRATLDSNMNLVGGPTQIGGVPSSILIPVDPATNASTNRIVYPGFYFNSALGGYVKSIFLMNLSDGGDRKALSLGRDHAGNPIICADSSCSCPGFPDRTTIMENDPKISPDGANVAFMRQAPCSGANSHGFHIFVTPTSSETNEKDISYASIGSSLYLNDGLPEWIDNSTLIFSTIEISASGDQTKNVYKMKSDGTQRTKISLPSGFRYADVFPFTDSTGKRRMIISAEKIGATCSH